MTKCPVVRRAERRSAWVERRLALPNELFTPGDDNVHRLTQSMGAWPAPG